MSSLFELESGRIYEITWEREFPVHDGEATEGAGLYWHYSIPGSLGKVRGRFTPVDGGPDVDLYYRDITSAC
jgi:hypothetical protein